MTARHHHLRRTRVLVCTSLLALAVPALLAGCGSSSSSSSTGASASSGAASAPNGSRRAEIAACLKKQGLSLPQRPPGAFRRGGGGPGFFGGGNATNSKFRAALRKCGINFGGGRRFNRDNPAFRTAVTKFAACVRKNGFDLPAPNLSGSGPVFDPSKVDRNDPRFRRASAKCRSLLNFRRPAAPPGSSVTGSAQAADS